MKISFRCFAPLFAAALLLLGAGGTALAQPALSVSPSVTSNSYTGFITLNITGLTNGEQVVIHKWIDLNGNGVIDAGEPMMDAFKLTDGGAMVIGGVTNVSVPYDSNPASGAITTTLNFAAAQALENMVGNYVYQVVSPSGHFAPITATFTVTNGTTSQSISGTIYDGNGVPFPNAVVVAQDERANNVAGAVVADSGGHYSLNLPTGIYGLLAVMPNTFFDQSLAPSVTLTNGMASTNNLYLTNGTVTISGNVYDAGNSNAIGGVMLQLQSGNWFAITFTDTNGNYSAALAPSVWKIQAVKERLSRRAYVLPGAKFQVDATGGSVTNANIGLPKGNALFYGRITDSSNNPFPNTQVDANEGNNYSCKGYSDANGYYGVAALADTNQWNCSVDSAKGSALANYIINFFPLITLSPGQTVLQNFVALPATDTISGHVQDNSGNPVTGVTLNANASIGGSSYQSLDGTTDSSGNYSLAVANGQWGVQFLLGGNSSDNLDAHGFEDLTAPHNVSVPPTNQVLNITVYPIGTPFITSPQRMSSTQFGFTLNGASNVTYTVQVSSDLSSTNWSTLLSLELTNTSAFVVDVNATNSPRFYRVKKD